MFDVKTLCAVRLVVVAVMGAWVLGAVGAAAVEQNRNLYVGHAPVTNVAEGISWPKGQALPTFATPAAELDAIEVQALSPDERITFSSLQGRVNRKQPRMLLLDARSEEGRDTWVNTATMGLGPRNLHTRETKFELLRKYTNEVAGVVLYDPAVSAHYRNLAGTVAGMRRALPVTAEVRQRMEEAGIKLPVVEDLTGLKFSTPLEIYGHLLERYWAQCEKRLMVSARPTDRGDLHHTRDMAAAVGAAVVWLDNKIPAERDLMRKFFGDMKAGEAIVLGWYTSERSGITTASEFGIGTMPADFFLNGSVFSGTDRRMQIPPVPRMPELTNKVYVALFISDGDNIQYTQRAMRRVWDRTASSRGKVPLNWTIAPGLVDIAPGIMNYYYTSATSNDCFVSGPSGMGYMMPFNTLEEPGAPVGIYTKERAHMDGYARLTETYLQRAGLRLVTIWDDLTEMQRGSYAAHGRQLYGVTVQNFKDVPSVRGSFEANRVRFDKLVIPYATTSTHMGGSLRREIRRWDGSAPRFLAYQANIWGELKPDKILALHEELMKEFPGKVEFVRADHYFNLWNQANGHAYNLVLSPKTAVTAGGGSGKAQLVADGTPSTVWTSSSEKGAQSVELDFGSVREVSRYLVRHAGASGQKRELNTRGFTVQTRVDADAAWTDLDVVKGNEADVSDVEFPSPVKARFFRVTVTEAGEDGVARIADVEVFGRRGIRN